MSDKRITPIFSLSLSVPFVLSYFFYLRDILPTFDITANCIFWFCFFFAQIGFVSGIVISFRSKKNRLNVKDKVITIFAILIPLIVNYVLILDFTTWF